MSLLSQSAAHSHLSNIRGSDGNSLPGIQDLKIENGKIQRSEDCWDATTFQKQLSFNTPEEKS